MSAHAEERHWDANGTGVGTGGTGTWDLGNLNWSPSGDGVSGPYVAPWDNSALDDGVFGGTAGTVTLASPITAHNLTFNTNGYILTGNTLTLGGTAPTISVATGTTRINSIVAGTSGLTKMGGGTLQLYGTNTFSGSISLLGGSLYAATDAGLGAATNTVTTAAGSSVTLRIDGAGTARSIAIGDGGTLTVSGAGIGSALISGNGRVSVAPSNNAASIVRLSNDANSYTGATIFSGCNGVCLAYFSSIADLGVASSLGAPTTVADGTIVFNQQSQYSDSIIYIGDGDISNRNWDINGNGANIRNEGSGALTLTGDIDISANGSFFATSADINLLGTLSGGSFVFNVTNGQTVTLGDANSFTGTASIGGLVKVSTLADIGSVSSLGAGTNINMNAGTVSYTGTGSASNRTWTANAASNILNDGTGALDLSGDLTFNPGNPNPDNLTLGGSFSGVNSFSGIISGNGNLISAGSGTWLLSGANTHTGMATVNSGTLRAGHASAFGNATGFTINGGTLDLNSIDLTAPMIGGTGGTIALGSATLTVKAATAQSYAGGITGTGGLTKSGAGTLTLTGANSYSGATTINGGKLTLDFAGAGAPDNNIISASSPLLLSGGSIEVRGANGETNGQSFNGLTVSAGSNTLRATSGTGGAVNVSLGAISRTGGLVNFVLPDAGAITTSNADGALGGWATINGSDYAKVLAGGVIAFDDTDYTSKDNAATWLTGEIISDTDGLPDTAYFGTVSGDVSLGGLRYTANAASTVTIGGGNTLGVDGTIIVAPSVGAANQTIAGGSLTGGAGGGTLGVQQNGAGFFTIGSTITDNMGATSFAKGGTGTVVLTGANSYTGSTTVTQGTLRTNNIGNGGVASGIGASSSDASNLVLEAGTLQYAGATTTTDRGFTLVNGGATRTIDIAGGTNLTFTGEVTSPDDAGFTKLNSGTLTLANAANTYSGVTTVNGGTLAVTTLANGGLASSIGMASSDPANIVLAGGTLDYLGGTTSSDRGITIGAGHGRIGVSDAGSVLTLTGTITSSGSGGLRKEGSGTLVLSGTNSYAGGTIVNAGTLRAGATNVFGGGAMEVAAGALLDLNNFNNAVSTLQGAGDIALGSGTLTVNSVGVFTGRISGTGGLTRAGASVFTLSGCNNSYTGATTITNGTALSVDCLANGGQLSSIGASTSNPDSLVFSNGILIYTGGSVTTDRGFTLASSVGAIRVDTDTTVLEFAGEIIGVGQLRKDGPGTLILSGVNNGTNSTRITGGILRAGSATAIGSGPLTLDNIAGVLLDLDGYDNDVAFFTGGGANGGTIDLGGATLTINAGSSLASANYAGVITGSGNLVKNGASTNIQQLSGCGNSYDGATVINGGTLAVACLGDGGAASSIGSSSADAGNLVLNGGTLRYLGAGDSTNRRFTLGSSATSKLEASGTGAIIFADMAALTFSSPNTAQTLTLGGTNSDNNILAPQITNNGTGITRLTKTDAGTWILTNPNSSYTGITTISGGVLGVDKLSDGGVASSIGASSSAAANLVIGNGSTLRYTGSGDTTNRLFTLSSGVTYIESSGTGAIVFTDTGPVTLANTNQARTIALGGTNTGNNTLAGSIGNAGTGISTLAKNDSGTWVLTGNHSYTGSTNVNGGMLFIGGGGTTGSVASGTVNNFGTLGFDRSDALTYAGAIVGTGSVLQQGAGTTILTGTSSYSGGTTISAGTLQLGNGGASGSIIGDVVNDGTLTFSRSNSYAFDGIISGNGIVSQIGTGTTVLTGINSYTGGTLIDAGTLQISADANLGAASGDVTFDGGTLHTTASLVSGRDMALTGAGTILTDAGTTFNLSGLISGAGAFTKSGAGTLVLTADNTYTGSTTISAGTLQLGDGGASGWIEGDVANNGTLIFDRSDNKTFAGLVSGSGGLIQNGSGIITLTADNSYGGATVLNAGTLRINGDQSAATGLTTVHNGATLGGSGIVGGSVLVDNGGTLAPGNSPGTLTIAGNLSLSSASILDFEFGEANVVGGPLNDLIEVGGNLVLDGTINVTVPTGGSFGGGIYRVFNYGGTLTDNGLDLGAMPAGSSVAVQTSVAGQVNLVNATGLELSFWDGGVGPKINGVVDGGAGTWHLGGTDNNWTDADGGINAAYADGSFAIFAGAGDIVTVDNGDGAVTASGMQFASDGYTITGDALTLTDPQSVIRVGDGTAAGAGFTTIISAELTGTAQLAKTDLGTLVLTGTNSYAGGTLIEAGTLQIGDGGATGSIFGDVDNDGTLAFNRSDDVTFAGVVSGGGDLVKQGGGVLTLTGANSYAGGTTIDAGTLRISSDANLGAATGGITFNGGTLNTTADITSSRDVVLAGGGTFQTGATTTFTLGGTISGAGSLTKTDLGLLILTGTNDYTGGTTITSGRLQLGDGGTTGSITGDVTNNATLIFNRSNAMTFAGAITGTGVVEQVGSGTTTLTGTSGYTGQTRVNNGELRVEGSGKIIGTSTFRIADVAAQSATMTVTGPDAEVVSTGTSIVGVSGTGILNIENGGSVLSAALGLGTSVNGNGTVNVRGAGSSLGTTDTAQILTIGVVGTGTLNVLDGGTVQAASSARIGTLGSAQGTVTVSGVGSRLETATGLTLAYGASTTGVLTIADDGEVVIGSGTLTMGPGNSTLNIGGAEGEAATGAGTLAAANVVTSANGRINFNHTDAAYTFASLISGAGVVNQNGPGTTILTGVNSYTGGTTINAGTLQISADANLGDAAGTLTFDGGRLQTTADLASSRTVALAGAGTILTDAATTFDLSGLISGAGALTKAGTGTLILTADNDYTGGTTITDGVLQLGDGGTSGSILGDVTNDGTLVFDRSDDVNFAGLISGSGDLVKQGAGILTLTADNAYIGGTTITAGTLQLGNGGTSGWILGDVANDGILAFNRSDDMAFAGLISGTGGVEQNGSGIVTLTGANSYAGATDVNAGTLLVNGDQSLATGLTSVASGAVLGGAGIGGGDVNVAAGGSINPGLADATPGVLTINGGLSLAGGATLNFDFGQANTVGGAFNDLIAVGGDLVLGGTLNVDTSAGGTFGPGIYRVINYDGTLSGPGLAIGSIPSGTDFYVQTSVANQVNLINTSGLALRFWDGAAGARNDGVITGGDGIWQNVTGNDNWTLDDGLINAPFLDSAFAVFQGMGGTVTVDDSLGAINVAGMQFAVDGYTVEGGRIDLAGPQAIIRVGDGTIAGTGYTATISSELAGSAQLAKTDAGTLILTGTNNYTGGTALGGGVLQIAADANLGDAAGGLDFDGGTLQTTADILSGRDVTLTGAGMILTDAGTALALSGALSGAGSLGKSGSGTLVLSGTGGNSGGMNIGAGTVFVNGDYAASTGLTDVASGASLGGTGILGGNVSIADGGTLTPGAGAVGTLTIGGNLTLASGSLLEFEFGEANVAGGALNDLVEVGGDLVLDGSINVTVPTGGSFDAGIYRVFNYGGALTDNGLDIGLMPAGGDVSVQTSIEGQVNLVNSAGLTLNFWDGAAGPRNNSVVNGGDGLWQDSTGNDNWTDATGTVNAPYTNGAFAIFAGTSGIVDVDNSLGAVMASGMQFATDGYTITGDSLTLVGPASVIRVGDASMAGAGYTATITAELTGGSQLVKTDAGTLVLSGANSYTGGTAINGGTLTIASDANLGDIGGGLSFDGGTLHTTAGMASGRAVDLIGAGAIRADGGTMLTLNGLVTGAGSFAKSGAGTLVLTADNSYTGATAVDAGTLFVNGDQSAATGLASVASGAMLGGNGTIGGNVILADGATLAPGAGAVGTLTIGGNLTLASGSLLDFEFGQANAVGGALNDLVEVGGNLTLDGTINVAVPAGGAFDAGIYRVFNYGGMLIDNGLALGTMPVGSNTIVQTSVAGQVNLVNSAGLTLNFWDGTAGIRNNGAIEGGDGLWQNSAGDDNWTEATGAVNAAYADGTFAIFSGTGGNVTVDNSLGGVTAAGMQFAVDGYVIGGDDLTLAGARSIVRVGDGTAAGADMTAAIAAALTGGVQLVKTDAGTLVLSGANSYTGGTAIEGGTLAVSADTNLGDVAGNVMLDGGTLRTTADLASGRFIAFTGDGTILTDEDTTFTLNGALSGTGLLTKAGAGTLVLTGNNDGYAAGGLVAGGTFAVDGRFGGIADVASGGRLEGNGSVAGIVNAGVVAPGRGIGTLTVAGDYVGAGGTLEIETVLGGDSSATDRLVIGGGTSGTTLVTVINRDGLGGQTAEGIKIIDIAGASNGSFALNGDYVFQGEQAVIAGAYGYRLYKNGVADPQDGDWYLRSSLLNAPEEPGEPDTTQPLYQPGVPVYEGYTQTLQALNGLPTLQQRVGNRSWAKVAMPSDMGIWGRIDASRHRPKALFSTSGTDQNIDSWQMQMGLDAVLSQRDDGATLIGGLTAHYGKADAGITSIFGNGKIDTQGYGLGATLTWYGPEGFYADAQAKVSWFDSDLTSGTLGALIKGNDGKGEAFSFESGKRSPIGNKLTLTPQIQMTYAHVGFDRFVDPAGAEISTARGDSLKTRWGLSIDHQNNWDSAGETRRSHVYGLVNLSYEWLDGAQVDVSGTPVASRNRRLWGELGIGGSYSWGNGKYMLYTEISGDTPIADFGEGYSLKGTAGFRVRF